MVGFAKTSRAMRTLAQSPGVSLLSSSYHCLHQGGTQHMDRTATAVLSSILHQREGAWQHQRSVSALRWMATTMCRLSRTGLFRFHVLCTVHLHEHRVDLPKYRDCSSDTPRPGQIVSCMNCETASSETVFTHKNVHRTVRGISRYTHARFHG